MVQASLNGPRVFWLHLEVGGEDVFAAWQSAVEDRTHFFNRHLNATRVVITRRVYNLGATPHGRDVHDEQRIASDFRTCAKLR